VEQQHAAVGCPQSPGTIDRQLQEVTTRWRSTAASSTAGHAEVESLQAQVASMEARVKAADFELRKRQDQLRKQNQIREQEDNDLAENIEWYNGMSDCFSQLGGVTVKLLTNAEAELELRRPSGAVHDVALCFGERMGELKMVMLDRKKYEPTKATTTAVRQTGRFDQLFIEIKQVLDSR